jgi:hypothetical protein
MVVDRASVPHVGWIDNRRILTSHQTSSRKPMRPASPTSVKRWTTHHGERLQAFLFKRTRADWDLDCLTLPRATCAPRGPGSGLPRSTGSP